MKRKLVGTVVLLGICQGLIAAQVTLPGFVGFGYNTYTTTPGGQRIGADGQPGVIGCGPTSGAMILNWFTSTGPAPGLIGNPLADARTMTTYMNTDNQGFGLPSAYQFGLERFASDRGYNVDALLHVSPGTSPANFPAYTVGPDIAYDAPFWNNDGTINDTAFLTFIGAEIDAGRPVGLTVDSDRNGGDDHWMVGVGYDTDTGMWAGYNTWDASLHWYDVQSAFDVGNNMGIAFVRTYSFNGSTGGGNGVPESGTTAALLGLALMAICFFRRQAASFEG